MQFTDALEQKMPALGLVRLRNGLRTATIDTQDSKMLARFQQQNRQHQENLEKALRMLKIPHVSLQTAELLFPALRQFFTYGAAHG